MYVVIETMPFRLEDIFNLVNQLCEQKTNSFDHTLRVLMCEQEFRQMRNDMSLTLQVQLVFRTRAASRQGIKPIIKN